MERVLITRGTQGETVGGRSRPARVFITGPHFGRDVFSSTEDREKASRFTRTEAERLLRSGKWARHSPEIEPA
jgi:hypothetical protein